MESKQTEPELLLTRFGKHTTAALSGAIIVKAMALVLVKVLTILLPKSEYGAYSIWISFILLASTFSASAFSATIWRFMPQRRSSGTMKDASCLFMTSIYGSISFILATFVFVFLLDIIGLRIVDDPLYGTTLIIVFFLAILYVLRELILVVSGSEQNSREILIFNLAFGSSSTVIGCLVGWMFNDYRIVFVGLTVGYAIPIIISLAIKVRQYGTTSPKLFDFRKSIGFGGPSILMESVKTFVPFITSLIIAAWIGLQEVATLSIAILLASVFSFIVNPPLTAYQAYIVNAYEMGSYERGNEISTIMTESFLLLVSPIVFLMIVFSPLLILLVSTEQYITATLLIPFTVISAVLLSFSYFWKIQLDLVEKPHFTGITYILSAIILVLLSVLLVPEVGLIGVGIAMVVQAGFVLVLLHILGNSQLPIRQKRQFLLPWTLASVTLVTIFYVLHLWGFPDVVSVSVSLVLYLAIARATGLFSFQRVKSIISLLFSR
ncbi:MAG: lipopolysaccharide biosynthesis protein [Candidatus Sifarchaeia archaeon]